MNDSKPLRVLLVDDEPLALTRLDKLLREIESVFVIDKVSDPEAALKILMSVEVDVLFLDIQMPGMNGFELLSKLPVQPAVIFTTAYDKYAFKAFEVCSIDYLLKPIEPQQLKRALNKIDQLRGLGRPIYELSEFPLLIAKLAERLSLEQDKLPKRIGSRIGERIQYIELDKISHFFSEDKATFAATEEGKKYIVDYTMSELEKRLGVSGFIRIHRASLVNSKFILELHRWFGGRGVLKLKDKNNSKLLVSRDKIGILRKGLGL